MTVTMPHSTDAIDSTLGDRLAWPAASDGWAYRIAKRVMDLLGGGLLMILLAPVMLVSAVLIKLTSRGPVFFVQERIGLNGQPFRMLKFRTMHQGAEEDRRFLSHRNEQAGPVFKIADDPRLTFVGRQLRRTSIDELPQLLNVLRGEMSLVGPRPLWIREAEQVVGEARRRTTVKPGLTCLWQVSGRSELPYRDWVALDLLYIRHRSLLLDLMILFQTVPAVLSCRGAY